MPGSERHHGTKRKSDFSISGVSHQTKASSHTSAGDKASKDAKVPLKHSMSSSSSKRKRHKAKVNRESSELEYFTQGDTAPPSAGTVKPLVEYDDISSDSDSFSDPPSTRPSERGGGDRLEHSPDYDRDYFEREVEISENKGHKNPRKKTREVDRVRDSGNGEYGYKKKSSKDGEKGSSGKSKDRTSFSGLSSKRQVKSDGDSNKRGELVIPQVPGASVGSTTSSTSSSRSKESSRSAKSRKDKQQRKESRAEGSRTSSQKSRTDRSHRKSSKSHKLSPKGKSSSRGSPRRKATTSTLSPSPRSESPQGSGYGLQGDDGYPRRRVAQSPSPYRESSRHSRQRSVSPYGSRHRSSSYERDSSPYSRRRSISPYGNRRSSSTSPMSR